MALDYPHTIKMIKLDKIYKSIACSHWAIDSPGLVLQRRETYKMMAPLPQISACENLLICTGKESPDREHQCCYVQEAKTGVCETGYQRRYLRSKGAENYA